MLLLGEVKRWLTDEMLLVLVMPLGINAFFDPKENNSSQKEYP